MEEANHRSEWFAVRTRPRSEKWVLKQLANAGIEAWIPVNPSAQMDSLKLITGENIPAEMTETFFEKVMR